MRRIMQRPTGRHMDKMLALLFTAALGAAAGLVLPKPAAALAATSSVTADLWDCKADSSGCEGEAQRSAPPLVA